jgi:hypothetical protein
MSNDTDNCCPECLSYNTCIMGEYLTPDMHPELEDTPEGYYNWYECNDCGNLFGWTEII